MLTIADAAAHVEVEEVTLEQGRKTLESEVSAVLGIALEDFLVRLDEGVYDAVEDEAILELVMLAPFAR